MWTLCAVEIDVLWPYILDERECPLVYRCRRWKWWGCGLQETSPGDSWSVRVRRRSCCEGPWYLPLRSPCSCSTGRGRQTAERQWSAIVGGGLAIDWWCLQIARCWLATRCRSASSPVHVIYTDYLDRANVFGDLCLFVSKITGRPLHGQAVVVKLTKYTVHHAHTITFEPNFAKIQTTKPKKPRMTGGAI